MCSKFFLAPILIVLFFAVSALSAEPARAPVDAALARAGENRGELELALRAVEARERPGLEFLIAHMPQRDLETLPAEFLTEHVRFAYLARDRASWGEQLPDEIFHGYVLPYASINERRDAWRRDFHERFFDWVKDAKSPGEAAVILNQRIFEELDVRYSTRRPKADQSPYESIEAKLASCTGLSILLIDACRAVGVPARFVGTPRWSDGSGNHSWVEVWDDGWHFTGAAEPTGDRLNEAWFVDRARQARVDSRLHAIYAVSYEKTPLRFPLVWDSAYDDISAVNVTDRYTQLGQEVPPGQARLRIRVTAPNGGERVAANVVVASSSGETWFAGRSKDERFDANDHLTVTLPMGSTVQVRATHTADGAVREVTREVVVREDEQLLSVDLGEAAVQTQEAADPPRAIEALRQHLALDPAERASLEEVEWAGQPLTREEAADAAKLLWADLAKRLKEERKAEVEAKRLKLGEHEMPFHTVVFGDRPETGRSLYISMHGGGGAPAAVNDRQWENQKRLYELEEGVYLAPRAPTNTWNLWHQAHIDGFFDRLITDMILFEGVDPDRVYLMGYSAGGDGVFQLAPRMADRFAAAAMMAGHPNETSPLGLRNLPFTLHMGGNDAAYERNEVAATWKKELARLAEADPGGYPHWVEIHADKGHWMDREDRAALPWMAKHRRNLVPKKVVWVQDDVTHERFYWLAVPAGTAQPRSQITATADGQTVTLESDTVNEVIVRLRDDLVDLDRPITVKSDGEVRLEAKPVRTVRTISRTLREREDPRAYFSAELRVRLRAP